MSQEHFDSDNEFEKPKDDFMFYYQAFRIEEKKMCAHLKFEEITTKYWQLIKKSLETDFTINTISKPQYITLMKCIYKALLPLYKESEMSQEIEEEWLLDSRGQSSLTFQLLTKVLFRVAHEWCTHIDIDEYIEMLDKIYNRITYMELAWTYNGTSYLNVIDNHGYYRVTFPLMDKKVSDGAKQANLDSGAGNGQKNEDWLECRSDESNKSDYDYKYEEDPDNMVVKKYKKVKAADGGLNGPGALSMIIKDPIVYDEEIVYDGLLPTPSDAWIYKLRNLDQIHPFGHPTQQFLQIVKNEAHTELENFKEQAKANLRREQAAGNAGQTSSHALAGVFGYQDPGLKDESNPVAEVVNFNFCSNTSEVLIHNVSYNILRKTLRDGAIMSLRLHNTHPKGNARSRSRATLSNTDTLTELNKFGYNPALERRVHFKYVVDPQYLQYSSNTMMWHNIYYLVDTSQNVDLYRADINRIESKDKLCLKEQDEIRKEEDFNHVETPYKRLRQIMLYKKFDSIYQDRAHADNKEQKRLKKLIDKEYKRKADALKGGNVAQKGLSETYEEKSFIKMMKGPFYQLDSKEGLREDDFVTCNEQDLIDAARTHAMRILVIGKPRAGKTMLCSNLAKKLDLVHINIDNWLKALLVKVAQAAEAEAEASPEEGEERPKILSDLEEEVYNALKQGGGPTEEQQIEMFRLQIRSPAAVLKGYLLDLSYYNKESSWASLIRQHHILSEPDEAGQSLEFTHLVELWCEDEDIRVRARGMRVNPEDGVVYSKWERDERAKPKIVNEDEDPPAEEENEVKPLDERALVQRSEDSEERIKDELHYYNTVERPAMEELLINFFDSQYIKLDVGGLTPDEILECVSCRIKPDEDLPLRPLALQIEGCSDFKSLLTEGLNQDGVEGEQPRKWSLWRQTDPVALYQGKVISGQPENAAHYHGNVFVFSSEENLKAFLAEPKMYLQDRPHMPSNFRLLMLGPKGAGKTTQAQHLNELYGWRVVDYKALVRYRVEELLKYDMHIPNNPQAGGRIGLSEQEIQDIQEGKSMPAWKFIPWILDELGYPLMKRKPPPPEEKQEEEGQEEEPPQLTEAEMKKKMIEEKRKREEEERKRKEEEELQKFKEDRRRRRQEAIEAGQDPVAMGIEDSEEEPIIIEDLSIDQLVLREDEETGKAPFVGGFILIGFPESEEHLNRLKAHGIEFDSVLYLSDGNDENEPGNDIKRRMKDVELYDFDFEFEQSQKVWNFAKEMYPDQSKEIFAKGDISDVLIRIRLEIDPFFVRVDDPENCRASADLSGEDGEFKLPKSDFGDYCPVTYMKDNWIVRGNQENEVTIFGKTYWLAGPAELEEFKFNPKQFLAAQFQGAELPLQPPPPRIMILGHRGAGTTSQIQMLCQKYKLEEFELKRAYLAKLKEEKDARKRRRLLDRGFRPPQPPEEEGGESPPDPEIEDDPEDFEKEAHERQVMKMIYENDKGYIIDGNWRDIPEGTINQTFQDLLFESRRVPEVVIILKCKEKATFDRCIDRQAIRNAFDKLMEAREAEKQRVRKEEREAYVKEITEVAEDAEPKTEEEINELLAQWDEARDAKEKEDDENDPEMPNYDAMEEVEREKLREQRTADDAMFEELATVLREKLVVVVDDIKGDLSAEFVHVKLIDRLKDNFALRRDIIERQLAQPLKPKEVKSFERSYNYKHSKFGQHSPIALANPLKTKNFAVLYRERIYFLSDAVQQQQFLREPSKHVFFGEETIPLDIQIKPRIFVVGPPLSGKTSLSTMLKNKLNIVHLRIQDIIDYFIERESLPFTTLRRQMKLEGRQIDDEAIVNLIMKRIQMRDCQTQGWVIDDFPKTRNQALFLAKKGLVPTNLIVMRVNPKISYDRGQAQADTHFGCFRVIQATRLRAYYTNAPFVIAFYQRFYNNVVEIPGTRSKWFIEDKAIQEIQKSLHARQQFAKEYFLREKENRACKMRDMHVDRCLMKQSLSEFKYYCPVTWKNEKLLVKCSANKEDSVLMKNSFFFFKSTKERDLFLANPTRFTLNMSLPKDKDMPLRVSHHKAAEGLLNEKQLNSHCPVTLIDEERVKKGDSLLIVLFKEGKFAFDNEHKLQRFLANPFKYAKASLPVKMPPPEDKISLFNLQKMDDSIAFMEQSLGQVVTRGLREVSENRLKHPAMSVKETMLKLFALFLKTENPANTPYMKKKYQQKMRLFIQRCELPEELYDLGVEKQNLKPKGLWAEYKEDYYNDKGAEYDMNKKVIEGEKNENFIQYMR